MPLVFQYGSNLSTARINAATRLCGRARVIGPAFTAAPYELAFTVWSESNGCAAADLLPGRGRAIWGVLYEIPEPAVFRSRCPPDRTCLDMVENEGRSYVRTRVQVCDGIGGDPLAEPVLTYLGNRRRRGIRTSTAYVRHILAGLREHRVPEEYVAYVRGRIEENLGATVMEA
ncbi:MAG: gamma-glutamylcyclotransferase family protein [Gemmatimonadota bacterium]